MKQAHRDAAEIAAAASSALAPRLTGRLAATVRAAGTKTAAIIRAGTARVPYIFPIHWGWPARHIEANPFMSRGARNSEGQWIRVYENYVNRVTNEIEGA
jgi:hypothetical protein